VSRGRGLLGGATRVRALLVPRCAEPHRSLPSPESGAL